MSSFSRGRTPRTAFVRLAAALGTAAVAVACAEAPTQPVVATSQNDVLPFRTTVSALALAPWSVARSPSPGATVVTDGTSGDAQMSYNLGSPNFNGTWRFMTSANEAATVTLPWTWTGLHSWYLAYRRLRPVIYRSGYGYLYPTLDLVNTNGADYFSHSGTVTFNVQAGDEYGFEIYGSHFDGTYILAGTFTVQITPPPPPPPPPPASPPTATLTPASGSEGSAVAFAASVSDPDGDLASSAWLFGDGETSTAGASVSHTYAQDGTYSVRLIVTDATGLADTATTTAQVANVAPVVASFVGATLFVGETYAASGSFTDPGADAWAADVDYGDGTGTTSLPVPGKSFILSHAYTTPGAFVATVRVMDDDATTTRTATVTVQTASAGLTSVNAAVAQLAATGALGGGNAKSLSGKVSAAQTQANRGNAAAARNQLNALLNELRALERSGRLSAEDADLLRTLIRRILTALGG